MRSILTETPITSELIRTETGNDYELYGDEWRKSVMKLTKKQIVEILRDECMDRLQPKTYTK